MKTNVLILAALVFARVASADMIATNPVDAVRGTLPSGWTILRVETNTYPFYRPKGKRAQGTGKQRQAAAGISRRMEDFLGFFGTIAQKCLFQAERGDC